MFISIPREYTILFHETLLQFTESTDCDMMLTATTFVAAVMAGAAADYIQISYNERHKLDIKLSNIQVIS